MQVRCQNCGARLTVPSPLKELKCPRCGALMIVPATGPMPSEVRGAERSSLKRVFEPIPRPVVYLAGALIAVLLASPFWAYLIMERLSRKPVLLPEETGEFVLPDSPHATSPPPPLLDESAGATSLDRFRGVQLEAGRDDLQRRFNLRLQNTRGMMPEIYEAERTGDLEQLTAYFYANALKEFLFVLRERRANPDEVERDLVEHFGPPRQSRDAENIVTGLGVGLPAISGESAARFSAYALRRELAWADDRHRVEAAIYHSPRNGAVAPALLTVRVSASAWLKAHQPLRQPVAPAAPSALDQPVLPRPTP